VNKPLINRSW